MGLESVCRKKPERFFAWKSKSSGQKENRQREKQTIRSRQSLEFSFLTF